MVFFSDHGLSFGSGSLGSRLSGFLLGFEPGSTRLRCLALLLGAAPRFTRFLPVGGHAGQRGCFGGLLGAEPVARQVSCAPFGFGAFTHQTGEFLLLGGSGSGGSCQFRGGKLAALGIGQRTLFRLDFRAQCDFGQALDMGLLRGGGLGGGLRRSSPNGLLRRNFVGLHTSLRRNNLFGGLHLPRFGGCPGTFIGGGTRQRLGFGSPFGSHAVRRVLAALPLQVHQSRQDFAQSRLPVQGKTCEPRSGEPNPVPPRAEGRIDRWNPVKPAAKPC